MAAVACPAGLLRVTVEASSGAVASCRSGGAASATYVGPTIEVDVGTDSFRPSYVQIAPVSSQSVVSGSVMLMEPLPSGWTVMVQPWLLPCSFRWAILMSPPLMVNASSRIRA